MIGRTPVEPEPPLVSVLVPTFNRPATVARAIRTVRRQTLRDWELIVVDDGSPQPVTLCEESARDPRIRVIRHDAGLGVSHARNTGLEHARGQWIAFLDDDDLWHPRKLALQLERAERAGATLVFSGRYTVDDHGRIVSLRGPAPAEQLTRTLLVSNLIGEPSSVVAHRSLFERVGGFDTELSVIADWDMWVRLSRVGVALPIPEMTTAIVAHDDSMQLTKVLQIPAELEAMRRRHAELLEAEQLALGSSRTEMWMAQKRWRAERSMSSLRGYMRVARRHRRARAIAYGFIKRRTIDRVRPAPVDIAPEWILEQLRTAPCEALATVTETLPDTWAFAAASSTTADVVLV